MRTLNFNKDVHLSNSAVNVGNKDTIPLASRIKYEYDNTESSSYHSGLRAGIQRGDNLMPKAFRFDQSGRSMVEMLGTLAIIGVLSIGGIMGYSYGMDKYRANETINDIMLRGVDIITQTARGLKPNLESEWGVKGSNYNMEAIHDETNDIWGVVVEDIPSRVCKMVGDALKSQATIYVGNAERNDVIATDPCELSEKNTMEFYFESLTSGRECKTDTDCGEGNYCDIGLCFNGNRPEGTARIFDKTCSSDDECNTGYTGMCSFCYGGYCSQKLHYNADTCTLANGTIGQCSGGECIAKGCTYSVNKCDNGYYCASPNTSAVTAFPEEETGSCTKASSMFTLHKIGNDTYYVSKSVMSWWDADASCKALGKNINLLDINAFMIAWDGTLNQYYEKTPLASSLENLLSEPVWTSATAQCSWNSNTCGSYVYLEPRGSRPNLQSKNDGSRYGDGASAYAVCH